MRHFKSFAYWSIIFSSFSLIGFLLYINIGFPSCHDYEMHTIPVFVKYIWSFFIRFSYVFYVLSAFSFLISIVLKFFKIEEFGRKWAFVLLFTLFILAFYLSLFQNAVVYDCGFHIF